MGDPTGCGIGLASWNNETAPCQRNSHGTGGAVARRRQESWSTRSLLTVAEGPEPAARQSSDQKASAHLLSQSNFHSPYTTARKKTDIIISLYKLLFCFCKGSDISNTFLKTPRKTLWEANYFRFILQLYALHTCLTKTLTQNTTWCFRWSTCLN